MIINTKRLFDEIRRIANRPLTQGEVNTINAILTKKEGELEVSQAGLDLIKQFEGCRLQAYPDPGTGGDPWTIGWGTTGPGIKKGVTWTQAMADARLVSDVERFAEELRVEINGYATTSNQFNAMLSMAYNVGLKAISESTLMRKHKAGDYAGAAAEFARWNRAAGQVLAGLTRRRAAEAALYRS